MNRLITYYALFCALFFSKICFSQGIYPLASSTFFIQCMVDFDSDEQIKNIQNKLNSIPYVKMCRLDKKSKSAFIITKDIDVIKTDVINSWFGEYYNKITCMNFGVYAVDKMQEFPLTNCK